MGLFVGGNGGAQGKVAFGYFLADFGEGVYRNDNQSANQNAQDYH